MDEYLEVHERLDLPADRLLDRLPFDLGFSWVLFGAPIALVIGLLLEMSGVAVAFASLVSLVQREPSSGMLRLDPALLPPLRQREDSPALR